MKCETCGREIEEKWIRIKMPNKTIEVETTTKDMKYIEAENLCKNGLRLLTIEETAYIYDNNLIKNFLKSREWIKHPSIKNRKLGYGMSALDEGYGGRLYFVGNDFGGDDGGYAFGVRFVKDVKK